MKIAPHTWIWLLIGLGVVAIAVWLLQPVPPAVELGKVQSGPLRITVTAEGKTRIRHRYVIAAPVSGRHPCIHDSAAKCSR